jgi:hypothetical protein
MSIKWVSIHDYLTGQAIPITETGLNIPTGIGYGIRPDLISSQVTVGGSPSEVDFFDVAPDLSPDAFARSPVTGNGRRYASAPLPDSFRMCVAGQPA